MPLPWLKPAVSVGLSVPLLELFYRALSHDLSAEPVSFVLNRLGHVALIVLLFALALTPLKFLTGWTWPARIRRRVGLFAFFYAACHFLTYVAVDHGLDLRAIFADVVKRPFITAGFLALALMVPLAVTSTDAAVRRLGYQKWRAIHRLTYVCGVIAVLHFLWRVKKDHTEPTIYAVVLGLLLGLRVVEQLAARLKKRRR